MKQIGIALLGYHDRVGQLPPGYLSALSGPASQGPNADCTWDETGPGWSWAASLLGDLEQSNLQRSIRFDLQITDPLNAVVRTTTVPAFVCPSEVNTGTFTVVDANGNPLVDVAYSSYAAMNGVLGVTSDAFDNNGVFLRNGKMRLSNITDGLSTTLFVGERATNMSSVTWTGAVLGGVVPVQRYPNPADQLANAEAAAARFYPTAVAITFPTTGWSSTPTRPRVTTPGIVNFLFGDGSVHVISNGIDGIVYEALLTSAGGEVIGNYSP